MINKNLFVFIAFSLTLWACNDIPDCNNAGEPNAVIVKFYNTSDSSALTLAIDSIKAADTDSIFYEAESLSTFNLILDPSQDATTFYFYTPTDTDTISFSYKRVNSVISVECGPGIEFFDITVQSHSFDSAAVKFDFLNIQLTDNIEIYN